MRKVTLLKVFTTDQDEAIRFYTEKLGFVLDENKLLGDYRWVVVRAPDNSEMTVNLELARTPDEKALVGRQAATQPLFTLTTDDCIRDHKELKARDVKFHSEPEVMPYGTGAMMQDLYGNRIYLFQEPR
jgi:catechol 2,3-dioxygenase-like lactoylglutathione lyase family enzyme